MHTLQSASRPDTASGDVRIAVVGGGSRGWATTLMNDLAQTDAFGGTVALYDVDYESARRNERLGEHVQSLEDAIGDWEYVAVETLTEALDDADFVVCSTQDPPAETFKHDLDIPKEYGVYQSVGDTVGPGGAFRTLRSVPQYREVAAGVREHCPDAWVFNFTNPMTTVTRTLYEEYPDINAIGICHEIYGVQGHFAWMVEEYLDEDASWDEIDLTVTGINHFTWVTEARWQGHDLFELVDRELEKLSPLPVFEPGDMAGAAHQVNKKQIMLDLYDRFGVLPAAGDRHLAEFVPWYLNLDDPDDPDDPVELHRWGIRLTPSSARVGAWDEGEDYHERVLAGDEEFELGDSHEEMVDLMEALLGLGPVKTNVNVPNRGQVAELPAGAVVETNALVTEHKVEPLVPDEMPRGVRNLVETHVHNQETLVRAGFEGDLDLAFQAFLADPLVGNADRDAVGDMFRDLVAAERSYLSAYDLDGAEILTDHELVTNR